MTHPGDTPEPRSTSYDSPTSTYATTPPPQHAGPPEQRPYPSDSTPPYGIPKVDESSSGGAARHVVSLFAGLVLPPLAYLGFDWAFGRYWLELNQFRDANDRALWPFAVIAIGALLLLLVAAAGRLSPVGPAIAAVLYGALPAVAVVAFRNDIVRAGMEIRDWDVVYNYALVNVPFYGIVLFPTVAALLLGTAIASAGRRRR
ncbi:hypothetical protein FE697_005920 [Mumia zhuanghuii]|uniref:Uncharacterized protein n=2 Tax=Mumia TaxID=1546255 RepID=A0ABW1QH42_9ACTN|nr:MULTISPECIES: hypothetical protein [Mumia]KAA1425387.1 hypothetical protein FE697_005920 [Mumia zhuanghuii]